MAVLALFGNISGLEVGVILMLAVLIFGSRLPEVAARVYTQFRRLREAIDRFRRDTGIDQEMREIQRNVRDAAWREQMQINLKAPEHDVKEREIGMPAQNVPKKRAEKPGDHAVHPSLDHGEAQRTKDVGLAGDGQEAELPVDDSTDASELEAKRLDGPESD